MATVSVATVEVGVRVGVGESAGVGVTDAGTGVAEGDPGVGEAETGVSVGGGGVKVEPVPPL